MGRQFQQGRTLARISRRCTVDTSCGRSVPIDHCIQELVVIAKSRIRSILQNPLALVVMTWLVMAVLLLYETWR